MCSIEWSKKTLLVSLNFWKSAIIVSGKLKCKEYKNKILRDMAIQTITEEMAKQFIL